MFVAVEKWFVIVCSRACIVLYIYRVSVQMCQHKSNGSSNQSKSALEGHAESFAAG